MSIRNKSCLVLLTLGLIAVASLLLLPIELLMPDGLPLSPLAIRSLSLVQPLVLVVLGVGLGCTLAGRIDLGAPVVGALVEGGDAKGLFARQLTPALLVATGTAAIILVYGVLSAPYFPADAIAATAPLPTRMLYGGIAEELMMRWGLMTLIVWVGWRLTGRPATVAASTMWAGIGIAAIAFAGGHLPLAFAITGQPLPQLIALILIGNALPGLAFGWLYWRFGLEAAMLAHALAHLLVWFVGLIAGGS